MDADGYQVAVDGGSGRSLGVNGSVTFADLAVGEHEVELSGVASNCTVGGDNPRTVSVTEGATASTGFSVSCEAIPVSASVPEPELPREWIRWSPPTVSGRTLHVGVGDDLQAAIDSASTGDEIVIASGWSGRGPYRIRNHGTAGWITLRSDATLPAYGSRVSQAQASHFPEIVITEHNDAPGIDAGGTEGWWIRGIEIHATGTGGTAGLDTDQASKRIVFDRVSVLVDDGAELRRGIAMSGEGVMLIGSRFVGLNDPGYDSQAAWIYTGPGPFRIHNNFLEGATENVFVGGADPVGCVLPADIEITSNHVYKRPSWEGAGLSYKNLLEFKLGHRILVEGNVFENHWAGAFTTWKSTNQGGGCNNSQTKDLTFRKNLVRNVTSGFALAHDPEPGTVQPMQNVLIADVMVEKWGKDSDFTTSSQQKLFQVDEIANLVIRRVSAVNTTQNSHFFQFIDSDAGFTVPGLELTSVEVGPTTYAVWGDAGAVLDDLYESSPRVFADTYAVQSSGGNCSDKFDDPHFTAEYFCVASASAIPSNVGADEAAVANATSGVRDRDLP